MLVSKLPNGDGQTRPFVVPLRTSHPKILKPMQLQENIGLT